ncbi:hypothetical protein DPMN_119839 [Dreissena polymorpha]|uniref:Uncharacterized protein n=1 Tax=Dreissena polymorpha TaxID=45954 RepID=A0A9D4JRM1_DREPO|nr:hypothetical protein DPMN_119839 [Dreissena polymorpha]
MDRETVLLSTATHSRDEEKNVKPVVRFTNRTYCSCKKDDLLSRNKNKADMSVLISTALT